MKIYFAGSIRAGRQDSALYRELIDRLKDHGQVLTEHVGGDLPPSGEAMPSTDIYQRDVDWITAADVIIAEVSQPSTGVGYELAYAEAHKIPAICLYHRGSERHISAMIEGNENFTTIIYSDVDEAMNNIKELLRQL